MCLAVPVRVSEVNGLEAIVEIGGVQRAVSVVLTPDVKTGDYVLVHAGFAIGTVDEAEARESLALLQQIADFYDEDAIAAELGNDEVR
jgi:hydrogenase expression/formation protein HypC